MRAICRVTIQSLASALVLFGVSALAPAQEPTMTEMIPQSASYALTFRNVNELKHRGDVVAGELGFHDTVSAIFAFIGGQLAPVQNVINDDSPCGAIWFEAALIEEPKPKQGWQRPIAVGVAISDTEALAEGLEVDHEAFVAGEVVEKDYSSFGHKHRYYRMSGRYLWVTSHRRVYDLIDEAVPASRMIPNARRDSLDAADFLLYFSERSRDADRWNDKEHFEKWITSRRRLDDEEREALTDLFEIFSSGSCVVGAFRLDRGLECSFDLFFRQDRLDEIRPIIRRFSPPTDGVSLQGLPSGEVLFAHAARTDAPGVLPAATALIRDTYHGWWGPWQRDGKAQQFASQLQQLKLLGLFGEIWPLIERYRVGLYRNPKPASHGLVSLVAILDSEEPERVVSELQTLAVLTDRTAIAKADDSQEEKVATKKLIRQLVAQLSDESFEKRKSAMTRLVLIGETALPYLKEPDHEFTPAAASRAKEVIELIETDVKEKLDAASQPGLLSKAKPYFVFRPNAEQRLGTNIDIMEIRTAAGEHVVQPIQMLAGPAWSQVRIAALENRVVIFFGSDVSMVDTTLENLEQLESGASVPLPEIPYGKPLHESRGAEFQISVDRFMRLMRFETPDENETTDEDRPALSSASLTLEPEFVSVEWRISLPDMIAIRKKGF